MLINATHDYALRMCAYLARKGGCASTREISEATGVSRDYLIQIAQRLRNAGIVEARTGKHGGYRLAKDPSGVSAMDVLAAVDESRTVSDPGDEACYVHNRVIEELERITIAEVM